MLREALGKLRRDQRGARIERLLEAVRRHIPAGTEEINNKALAAGAALIAAAQE